ncbi:MAG: 30S ribosomal protein S1, partial [Planctomycetaceae bacterium]
MVDRNLIREFGVDDDELDSVFAELDLGIDGNGIDKLIVDSPFFETGKILTGTVLRREGDDVLLDVGCKSEGIVPYSEWEEGEPPPEAGQLVEVLLEEFDDQQGVIKLSRRKAKRIRDWEKIISTRKEGDVVAGTVMRKIKGGLLV